MRSRRPGSRMKYESPGLVDFSWTASNLTAGASDVTYTFQYRITKADPYFIFYGLANSKGIDTSPIGNPINLSKVEVYLNGRKKSINNLGKSSYNYDSGLFIRLKNPKVAEGTAVKVVLKGIKNNAKAGTYSWRWIRTARGSGHAVENALSPNAIVLEKAPDVIFGGTKTKRNKTFTAPAGQAYSGGKADIYVRGDFSGRNEYVALTLDRRSIGKVSSGKDSATWKLWRKGFDLSRYVKGKKKFTFTGDPSDSVNAAVQGMSNYWELGFDMDLKTEARVEELQGFSWEASSETAGATDVTYTFKYKLSVPDPYFIFYALANNKAIDTSAIGNPINKSMVEVRLNGKKVTIDNQGKNSYNYNTGLFIRLKNQKVAAGTNVEVTLKGIKHKYTPGTNSWKWIRTSTSGGHAIEEVSAPKNIVLNKAINPSVVIGGKKGSGSHLSTAPDDQIYTSGKADIYVRGGLKSSNEFATLFIDGQELGKVSSGQNSSSWKLWKASVDLTKFIQNKSKLDVYAEPSVGVDAAPGGMNNYWEIGFDFQLQHEPGEADKSFLLDLYSKGNFIGDQDEHEAYVRKEARKILHVVQEKQDGFGRFNLVVFNQYDGSLIDTKSFPLDVEGQLRQYIDKIPDGRIVGLVICGQSQNRPVGEVNGVKEITDRFKLSSETCQSIDKLGSTKARKWGDGQSWLLVGQKGGQLLKEEMSFKRPVQASVRIQPKAFTIYSKAIDDDKSIWKDGEVVHTSSSEDLELVVFNEYDGTFIEQKSYVLNESGSKGLLDHLDIIPSGCIVAIAANVPTNLMLSQKLIDAFKTLGSEEVDSLKAGDAWVLMGYKDGQLIDEKRAHGKAKISATLTLNFTKTIYQKISNRSHLVQDHVLENGQIKEKTRYRTILSVDPDIEEVELWAEQAIPVEIGGKHYSLSAKRAKAIKVKPNAMGKIIINIDEVTLSVAKIYARTFRMKEGEKYIICPDVEVHKKLNAFEENEILENKDDLFHEGFFDGMSESETKEHCKHVHTAVRNLASSIQYKYDKVGDSIHHDRTLQPLNMEHSNFEMSFSENGMELNPVSHKVVKERLQPLQTDPQQGIWDDFTDAVSVIVATVEHVGEEVVHTLVNEVERDIIHPLGEALVQGEHVFEDMTIEMANATVNLFNDAYEEVKHDLHVIYKTAEGFVHRIITGIEELGQFIYGLFEKLGLAIEKVWEYLKFVANWDDILDTQNAMINIFDQSLEYIKSNGQLMSESIIGTLNGVEKTWVSGIEQIQKDLVIEEHVEQSQHFNSQEAKGSLEWLLSHMSDSDTQESIPAVKLKPETTTKVSGLLNEIKSALEAHGVEDKLLKAVMDLSEVFTDDFSMDSFIYKLLELVKDLGALTIRVMETVVDLLFKFFHAIVEEIHVMINESIDLPFVSEFYRYITNGRDLSLLGVSSLLVAVPYTILYKLILGKKPDFSSGHFLQLDTGDGYGICQFVDGIFEFINATIGLSENKLLKRKVGGIISLGSAVINSLAQYLGTPSKREIRNKDKEDMYFIESVIWYYQFFDIILSLGDTANAWNQNEDEYDDESWVVTLVTVVYEGFHWLLFGCAAAKYGQYLNDKEKIIWGIDPVMGFFSWIDEIPAETIPQKIGKFTFNTGRCAFQVPYGILSIKMQ